MQDFNMRSEDDRSRLSLTRYARIER